MKIHTSRIAPVLLFFLASCGPSKTIDMQNGTNGVPVADASALFGGLTNTEISNIKMVFMQRLVALEDHDSMGGNRMACTEVFDIGQPVIKDVFLSGESGKVRISIPITGARPIDRTAFFSPRYYYPSANCYGAPPSGWAQGMTATSTYEVNIERWQTGWRMSAQQNLVTL